MKSSTIAKFLVAFSGMAWGVFWIPLHRLEQAGMSKEWAVIFFNLLPSLLILPVAVACWRRVLSGGWLAFAAGLAMGTTQIFYALAFLHTDVVRAITLFYLNPVWTAVAARYLLGERLGSSGLFAMLMAFAGMGMVLHTGMGLPLPENTGDWFAIIAGFAWAAAVILLRFQPAGDPIGLTVHALLWTGFGLIPIAAIAGLGTFPGWPVITAELWWLVPFIVLVLMSGVFASMWAVPKLSPNLVTLIYMTEISTAAVTAALFADQEFTLLDGIGIALITLAGAFTSIWQMLRKRSGSVQPGNP